jgi:excinuclease ABC subunit A
VIAINQSPIGRTPRSNPATYTGMFNEIRTLFTRLPEAAIRGYKPGRFSFNVPGGRCEECKGAGLRTIEMNFLPDVHVVCETCKGKRYNRETLEVRYRGKSIADILDMTVHDAVAFFDAIPKLKRLTKTLQDVGLGYITLGQQSTTLSGGEAQRVKLASELARVSTGNTIYLLDEPTTGLHFQDIQMLIDVLQRLVDQGNTVLVIEHNIDVLKVADHLIDVGPNGGESGGEIVVAGTPEEVAICKESATAPFLHAALAAAL